MLTNIEACIFDMDGTLVDSMWMWKQIDIDFYARFNIDFPQDLQSQIEGMSFRQTAEYMKEHHGFEISVEEMMSIWNDMAMDIYLNRVFFKDGVEEFLQMLKNRRIKLGIATSNSRELFDAVRKSLNLDKFFDCMLTGSEIVNGKPAPDVYLEVARRLNVHPSKCLVFEDIIPGIEAGHRAGMKVCGVDDEYSKSSRDSKISKAEYYINSFKELL